MNLIKVAALKAVQRVRYLQEGFFRNRKTFFVHLKTAKNPILKENGEKLGEKYCPVQDSNFRELFRLN